MSLLGIDMGTSGCKAAAFATEGKRLVYAYREYPTLFPFPGSSELDSQYVWQKIKEVIAEIVPHTAYDPITALCVSSMGEAAVPVTYERKILDSCIVSSDNRGQEYIDNFPLTQEAFYEINPNILATCYTLPKLLWLKDNKPEIYQKADKFLLWDGFLGFMSGCEPFISYSEANRTLLFDIHQEDWSETLLSHTGIDKNKLPKCLPAGSIAGEVRKSFTRETGLPTGVKVVVGGHDQCCNALGAGIFHPGKAVDGIGTYECITPVFDHIPETGRMLEIGLNVEHHVIPGLYVSFLYNQAGSLIRWFRDTFACEQRSEANIIEKLTLEMPEGPSRLLVLPYFESSGSPHYVSDASGVIVGLKTSTDRGRILKAIMESITFYFVETVSSLKNIGIDTTAFIATGGGSKSDAWLQIKADIFGVPFVRPASVECGIIGAAILAGLATDKYSSIKEAVELFVSDERQFDPDLSVHKIYRELLCQYTALLPLMHDYLANFEELKKKI